MARTSHDPKIEIILDSLQVFTACYKELLHYHRRSSSPLPEIIMETMEIQDRINQNLLALWERTLDQQGYNTHTTIIGRDDDDNISNNNNNNNSLYDPAELEQQDDIR